MWGHNVISKTCHAKRVRLQGDSGSEPDGADEAEQLEQEMGDVGIGGDVVDERLWGQDDKPEPGQAPGEEKYERDAPVQARDRTVLCRVLGLRVLLI